MIFQSSPQDFSPFSIKIDFFRNSHYLNIIETIYCPIKSVCWRHLFFRLYLHQTKGDSLSGKDTFKGEN